MKTKNIYILCAFLCGISVESNAQTLNFDVKGLDDGTKMVIEYAGTYDNYQKPLQVVELKDGKGQAKLNIDGPRGYLVHVADAYGYETITLSPDETATFSANYTSATSTSGKKNYDVKDVKVTGSPTCDYYFSHKANRDSLNILYEKYHKENKDVVDKLSKATRGSEEYKNIVSTPEYKKFEQAEKDFFDTVEKIMIAPVIDNKSTWWGPFFLTTAMTYLTEAQKPIYDQFSDEAKNSFYGKVVGSFVNPVLVKGTQMPDFTFTDHKTGKKMSLYEICKKNKYVLIDFWASWCGPCRREIPNFKSQYELYKSKEFDIISISADEKEADWLKALDEEKLEWPNDRDGNQGICALYKVSAYPTVYLLDSEGKAVAKNMDCRGDKLKSLLAELFK